MTDNLKPYPAYKDSGVAWLGDVPEHWEVRSLGSLTSPISLRGRPDLPLLSVVREKGVIPRSTMGEDENHNFIPDDLTNYKVVRAGDLVINKMKAWQGSLGIAPSDGIVSPAYFVFDFGIDDKKFGHLLLRSRKYIDFFARASDGVRIGQWDLSLQGMKRIPIALPTSTEQSAIVRYLDHMDRRIRRYIRAKKQMIALLNEQKQAIIHQAVTRGLDPNVKLKPSGVEWLGDVPEHWEIKRLKFLANITSGQVDPRAPEHRGKILIAPNHIEKGSGKITHFETANEQGADSGKYLVQQGQIVYSKIRPNLRKAAIAPMDCLCSADMYPLTVRESELRPEFLLLLLLSQPFTKYVVDCSLRVAMPKVNREALGECSIWHPNLQEQDSILHGIAHTTSSLNPTVEAINREITLLQEYRIRLIADVVTGKLDVREAAAALPDELEDDEPLDEMPEEADDETAMADTMEEAEA